MVSDLHHLLEKEWAMKDLLSQFILDKSFPCVMAKSVLNQGNLSLHEYKSTPDMVEKIYDFIDVYRKNKKKISSFIVTFPEDEFQKFEDFENKFWDVICEMRKTDQEKYSHDRRVASDPQDERYSFSMKEEAFFILMLHPKSPRLARRFKFPTIVFNPHQQFEELRNKGLFKKVRNLIREKDKLLQGFINPMLKDFGEKSEAFQYTGRPYQMNETIPLFS